MRGNVAHPSPTSLRPTGSPGGWRRHLGPVATELVVVLTAPSAHRLPHRIWRGLPPILRRRVLARTASWLAPRAAAHPAPVAQGVAIAGEMSRASGLGEGARLMAGAVRGLKLPVWIADLAPPVDDGAEIAPPAATGLPPPGVPLVVHVNAPMLPLALLRLPRAVTHGRHIIGYWAWELPEMPAEWRPGLACVNEIWVPSRFTAAALEPHLPNRVRVVPPALAMLPPRPARLDRSAFSLPQDAVVVLVSFNLASSLARKNPFAAIAAFHAAFGDRADRILLLKIGHPNHAPEDFARLVQMAQGTNIRLETRILPPDDSHALTACVDIVLSLHRSEGFGLVLAEAMLLGKAVIATGWSGNTDFMDASNAALVGYRLVRARDSRSIYRDSLWAQADPADAVARLRQLGDDPQARLAMGQRARASTMVRLGPQPLTAALRGLGMQVPQ
jgi:glycosyltransferase involved in cell wall biosynthesis